MLKKLNNKLEVNTSKEEKTSEGKLVIQVMNEIAGNVPLEISYLTSNAGWTPFYDLRTNSVAEPIDMIYKAQVVQNTGIDWKKVKLTLSSGLPNQNNQAPTVNPWFLRYKIFKDDEANDFNYFRGNVYTKGKKNDGDGYVDMYENVDLNNIAYDTLPNGKIVAREYNRKNFDKSQETYFRDGDKQSITNRTTISESQLNVTFDIDIPYDILSNGKKHSVSLKEIKLPATYKYYAAPKLDKEAFLLAEITDYGKYNLLKGEANIIFEGMYVGKTMVNPNQTSDTLNLSMGRDKKVSIKREKVVEKSGTKFLSSKKEQTFTYDIIIRNNKKEAVAMKLEDQYPLSTDKEIEIELKEKDGAKVNTETGILTWEIDLKPNETKKIRLSYSIKYPKNKVIDNL